MKHLRQYIRQLIKESSEFEEEIKPAIMRALDRMHVEKKYITRDQGGFWKGDRGFQIHFTKANQIQMLEFADDKVSHWIQKDDALHLEDVYAIPEDLIDSVDIE